jgi:RND superfamily putative drug exporter
MSGDGMQVVLHDEDGVATGQVRASVERALEQVAGQDGVASVQSPYGGDPQAQRRAQQQMVSEDGTTAVATVRFTERAADIDPAEVDRAQAAFADVEDLGVQVEYGGAALDRESGGPQPEEA